MTTPRHEASDSQEPSHPTANRPRHLDIYASDYGDIDNPIPSPPYQRDPSSAHLLLQDHPEHSPAYRSRSNLDLPANMGDQKTINLTGGGRRQASLLSAEIANRRYTSEKLLFERGVASFLDLWGRVH